MFIDTYAYEDLRLICSLERDPLEVESDIQLAGLALSATEAFAGGWLEPLAWELYIACRDTETWYTDTNCVPPLAHWLLRKERVLPGVRVDTLYAAQVAETIDVLRPEAVEAWITEALRQECPGAPGSVPAWSSLRSRAVRVKLPDELHMAGRETLGVDCYAGLIQIPLEREPGGVWVSGPLEDPGIGPPVELSLENQDGSLSIHIQGSWRLWLDDNAGREQVDAAVARVLALGNGWQRVDR